MEDSLDSAETALIMDGQMACMVLDSLTDAVIVTDTAGVVQYVNRTAAQLLGVVQARARNQPVHDILRLHDGATDKAVVAPLTYLLSRSDTKILNPGGYTQLVHRNGTKLAIDYAISTIRAGRQTPAALVLTLHVANRTRVDIG